MRHSLKAPRRGCVPADIEFFGPNVQGTLPLDPVARLASHHRPKSSNGRASASAKGAADFHPRRLLTDVLETCSDMAGKKGVALQLVVSPTLPEWLRGDGPKLRQAVVGLLRQAIRRCDPGRLSLNVWTAATIRTGGGGRLYVSASGSATAAARPSRAKDTAKPRSGLAASEALAHGIGGEIREAGTDNGFFALTLEVPLPAQSTPAQSGSAVGEAFSGPSRAVPPAPATPSGSPKAAAEACSIPAVIGGEAFVERMRELFGKTVTEAIARMGAALAARNAQDTARQAHAIVNSAVVVGAADLAALAREIEAKAMAGNIEAIAPAFRRLLGFDQDGIEFTLPGSKAAGHKGP